MATATFKARVEAANRAAESLVCVGLDPDLGKFPAHLQGMSPKDAIIQFNRGIVEATKDLVCAYKPNLGFYAAYGTAGIEALVATREMIPSSVPVILDCKVGDIGSTATAYARGYFDEWGFDAITANPYLGEDSLDPFLRYEGKGVIVLCKTSNAGSGDLQDLTLGSGEPLFMALARMAVRWQERYPATVGLVVGATYPAQLAAVRGKCPELPILLPGVGAQAGDVQAALDAGLDANGLGLIVTSSRGIIYAGSGEDFAEKAREATLALRAATSRG